MAGCLHQACLDGYAYASLALNGLRQFVAPFPGSMRIRGSAHSTRPLVMKLMLLSPKRLIQTLQIREAENG